MATQLKEPDQIDDTGVDEPQTQERDYEAEARVRGWRPPEEFAGKGEPLDAKSFLERGEERDGLAQATVKQQNKRISILESMLKKVQKSEQRAYENALADLKRQQEDAVATGDIAAFRTLDADAEKLRKDMTSDTPNHGEDPDEKYDDFREANPWYDKANLASASEAEVEARLFADRLADRLIRQGVQNTLSPTAFFERIASETEANFPTLRSKSPRTKPASDVAGVTRTGAARNARTGANLPPEAKSAAERYMRQKIGAFGKCTTKAEAHELFARDFDWEDTK